MLTNALNTELPSKEIAQTNKEGAKIFSIGNLSDIADTYSMNELFNGIDIQANVRNWDFIHRKNLSKELWWDGKRYQKNS